MRNAAKSQIGNLEIGNSMAIGIFMAPRIVPGLNVCKEWLFIVEIC